MQIQLVLPSLSPQMNDDAKQIELLFFDEFHKLSQDTQLGRRTLCTLIEYNKPCNSFQIDLY